MSECATLIKECRWAWRRLVAARAFTVVSVVTLAIGLGGVTAVFAVLHAVVLEPLPHPEPGRLVAIRHTAPGWGVSRAGVSEGTYLHYRRYSQVFADIGLYLQNVVSLTDRAEPERVQVALVTPSVFRMLGVVPAHGRLLTPADGVPGSSSAVLLSHELWTRRYGGDPGIVGRTIELNGRPREVAGVLPRDFSFPSPDTRVWFCLEEPNPAQASVRRLDLRAVARMKPNVSREAAERALRDLIPSLVGSYRDATRESLLAARLTPLVIGLADDVVGEAKRPLVVLFAAMGLVLLMCWANVAGLFLVHAESRRRHVSVQRALGATRWDTARGFIVEALIVGTAAGAIAAALTSAFAGAVSGFGLNVARLHDVRLGWPVVLFAAAAAVASGLALAAVACVRAHPRDLTAMLRTSTGQLTPGRASHRTYSTLVGMQVALALTVLIASLLMIQSFRRLTSVRTGFDDTGVLTFSVTLPARQYRQYDDARRFYVELLTRLRGVPGVTGAGAALVLPLTPVPTELQATVLADAAAGSDGGPALRATLNLATSGYFQVMRIPLLEGTIAEASSDGNEEPVVISSAVARSFFGAGSSLGRRLRRDGPPSPRFHVAGVVGDTVGDTLATGPAPAVYLPISERPTASSPMGIVPRDLHVVVRTNASPSVLAPAVRLIVRQMDPRLPTGAVRSLGEMVSASAARTRVTMLLLSIAAAAGLVLAVVGAYGVTAYAVSRRSRELALRVALGADAADVRRTVMRQASVALGSGVCAGLALSAVGSGVLRGLLFEISPRDPLTFILMPALLVVTGLAAGYAAARRIERIDPASMLKAE